MDVLSPRDSPRKQKRVSFETTNGFVKPSLDLSVTPAPMDIQNRVTEEWASAASSSSLSISDGRFSPGLSTESSSEDMEETEVQSSFRELPEQTEPPKQEDQPKKGLSKFFGGKSRSFSSLADVSSLKDLPKPENPYAKKWKRLKNLEGQAKKQFYPPCNPAGRITKKSGLGSSSNLALAFAMSEGLESMDWALSLKELNSSSLPRSFSMAEFIVKREPRSPAWGTTSRVH